MTQIQNEGKVLQKKPNWPVAILGCFGGMFIHLIIGAYFQWGYINVYVTSYYKISEPDLTLQSNGIVFPLMQLCIAPTMKLGHVIASKIGVFKFLIIVETLIAGVVFASSFIPTFLPFVFVFGMGIGLLAGFTFIIPLIQCNKFMAGYRMAFNGIILTGTGLGALIFGQFFYNFVNPQHVPSNQGYYDQDLIYIAQKVPTALRFLALIYIVIGYLGALMLLPLLRANEQQAQTHDARQLQLQDPYVCPSMCASLTTPVFYAKSYVIIFAVCGNLLLNGNFKTYVRKQITDDNFLTIIGTVGSLGNALCRLPWNMLFLKIGYQLTLMILCFINTIVFVTIRYTVQMPSLYCFMVFLSNACLGGFLVLNITHSHMVFGIQVGSNLDLFYWSFFSLSNFIGYFYVTFLSSSIGFNNIFYICVGMNLSILPLLAIFHFESKWSKAQNGIKDDETLLLHQEKQQYQSKIKQIRRQNKQQERQKVKKTTGQTSFQSICNINQQNQMYINQKTEQKLAQNIQQPLQCLQQVGKFEQGQTPQSKKQTELKSNNLLRLPPLRGIHQPSKNNKIYNSYRIQG